MVTLLKPVRPPRGKTPIADEDLPGTPDPAQTTDETEEDKRPQGVELSDDVSGPGTGSAPGEGPNPTA